MNDETPRQSEQKNGRQVCNTQLVATFLTAGEERSTAEHDPCEELERLQRWNIELKQLLARRTTELRQSRSRLRALAGELSLAEQRERKRLANELHDHLQQILVLGKLTIGQGKRFASGVPDCQIVLKKVDDILSDALTYSRTLVTELSPSVLHDYGLAAGLKWLREYMKTKYDQTVTVVLRGDQDVKLQEDQGLLLFQSVRELLINSSKYAGTGEATVRMEQCNGYLQIEVRDEGAGFNLATVGAPSSGASSKFGLSSIHERMQAIGGSFSIHSAPRQGTTGRLVLRTQ